MCATARIPGDAGADREPDAGVWTAVGPDAIRAAPWGVLLVDPDGRIRAANPAAERLLGASPGLLAGCDLTDPAWRTIGEDGAACVPDDHPARQASRQCQEVRRVLGVCHDGASAHRWLDVIARPAAAEADGPPPVIVMLQDVTEALAQAASLRAATERLRVVERTDALGQFTAGIAHDFKNLLFVINASAEMLHLDLPPGDPRQGDVRQIREAGEKGASLVNRLMLFSRQKPGQARAIDLHAALVAMQPLLRRLTGAHVTLDLRPPEGASTVLADPSEFEQVIINLAGNARDAMPNGGRLTIGTSAVTLDDPVMEPLSGLPSGAYVVLSVADTGCGMDEATRRRIFEPLFTTKAPGRGTGLGLATVERIVTLYGGRVMVESAPGEGTTFLVYLPASGEAADAGAAAVTPSALTPARGGEVVLLVEDDEDVRELARRILESAGYEVRAASDGREAEEQLRARGRAADLVLMDVSLPGGSGADVARRLTALVPGLRVLFMSGYPDESVAELGVPGDGAPFISKPFTIAALTGKVRDVLGR